jgi:type VI secretion system secreted protein Hcp
VPFDAFLKLDTVAGESADQAHSGEIPLSGYNLGVSHPINQGSVSGGAGAGKASFADFSFTTPQSKASPILVQACAAGTRFNQAVVSLRKAGAQGRGGFEFFKMTMSSVFVSSLSSGGSSGDDVPHDQVTLSFAKIQFQYTPQLASGAPDRPVTAGWDITKNAPA